MFLTSALCRIKWSASCPGRSTPGETDPGNVCIGAVWAPDDLPVQFSM